MRYLFHLCNIQRTKLPKESRDVFDLFGRSFQKIYARYIEFCDSIRDCIGIPAHLSISADCLSRDGRSVFRDGKWERRGRPVPVAFPNFRSHETSRRMPVYDPQRAIRIYSTTRPIYNWRATKFASYQCKRCVHIEYFDVPAALRYFRLNVISV